jgi:hypothetical protein
MSAKNPKLAVVAQLTTVYIADPATVITIPAAQPTSLSSEIYTNLGNLKTAFSLSQDYDTKTIDLADYDEWITLSNLKATSFKLPLGQFDQDTWPLITGAIMTPDTQGVYDVGGTGSIIKDVYVELRWGLRKIGFYFPDAIITAQGDFNPSSDDAATIELTFQCDPNTRLAGKSYRLFDDPTQYPPVTP